MKFGEKDDLASACTLCSVSALCTPLPLSSLPAVSSTSKATDNSRSLECMHKTTCQPEESDRQQEEIDLLNIPVAKKPSYLGLACSLSGYSGLTSYDSKLREGFRTRDRSPAPPPPRQLTCTAMPKSSTSSVNGIGSGSNVHDFQTLSPRSHINGTMAEEKSPQAGSSVPKDTRSSSLRESSRQFMSTMLTDEMDFSNCTPVLNVHPRGPSPITSKDSLSPSGSTQYTVKQSSGTVRVVEFTSQTKSYVSAIVSSSTTSRTSLQSFTSKETHQYSSETAGGSVNGSECQNSTQKAAQGNSAYSESESAVPSGFCISKSFVQQRIERLYGPGALAQGFFSRTRQQSLSEEEHRPQPASQSSETSSSNTAGSPSLPVLRHLRPEFRAQLPLTSLSATRSPRHIPREMASVYESLPTHPILQQQTSVESISDSQPAAPEVPVLVGDNLPVANSIISNDTLKSPALCKEAVSAAKREVSMDKSIELSSSLKEAASPVSVSASLVTSSGDEEKDGHYFLEVLRAEIRRLNKLVESAEEELVANKSLPEEAQGKLRAASGQARLLVKQKLQQFEGLCHKNINQSPDEVFPTTAQDLAGFWDMVKLQVDHVDRLFVELDQLKSAGWIETPSEAAGASGGLSAVRRKSANRRSASSLPTGGRTKNSEDSKKGSEGTRKKEELALARKRMMEEKRRALRQQQQLKAKEQENIEIFIPQENGK